MERKIGEIFEFGGEWYQCIGNPYNEYTDCDFCFETGRACVRQIVGQCSMSNRSDGLSVVFKKLEKVGEPIEFARGLYFQRYQLADSTAFYEGDTRLFFNAPTKTFVYIEIKTKEDMEEKNNAKHSNSEKVGKNLRPFDLQKARDGKPVCTRDGRKARIICFDRRLFYKNVSYPILALVERSDGEDEVCCYNEKGKVLIEDGAEYKDDLMMLPEKKEGWVNVYKERIYSTKEEAIEATYDGVTYVDTVKVCWEE